MAWSDLDDARVAADTPENHLADHNALHALANDFHDTGLRHQHVWTTAKGGNDANTGLSKHDAVATVAQAQANLVTNNGTERGVIFVWPGRYEEQVLLGDRQHLIGMLPGGDPQDSSATDEYQVVFQPPDGANWEYVIGCGDDVGTGNAPDNSNWWHWGSVQNINVWGRRDENGVSAVQRITNTGPGTGTFTLTFEQNTVSEETAAISASATAANVESALEALTHIENVTCTGGPLNSAPIDVTFTDRKAVLNDMTVDNTGMSGGTVSVSTTTAGTGPTVEAGIWVHQMGEQSMLRNVIVRACSGWQYRHTGSSAGGLYDNIGLWKPGAGGGGMLFNAHQDAGATSNAGEYTIGLMSGDENEFTKSVVLRQEGGQTINIAVAKLEGWDVIVDQVGSSDRAGSVHFGMLVWEPGSGAGTNLIMNRRASTSRAYFGFTKVTSNVNNLDLVDDSGRDAQAIVAHRPTGLPGITSSFRYGDQIAWVPAMANNEAGVLVFMGWNTMRMFTQRIATGEDPWEWFTLTDNDAMTFTNDHINGFTFFYDDQGGTTDTLATLKRISNVPHLASGVLSVEDGVTAPSAISGQALIYVDTADGDLKVRFGDGTTKTISVDT